MLQVQSQLHDLDQGTSAVFSVFTNAACMFYTIRQSFSESQAFHRHCTAVLPAWQSLPCDISGAPPPHAVWLQSPPTST